MGLKRPFDAEEMQECNAKHARQLTYSHNQLNQFDEAIPYHHVSKEKTSVLVEDLSGLCENPTWSNDDANHVEKGFETCAPFSWNPTTGLCQEDDQSGGTSQSALSHQSSGSDFTGRPPSPVEDVYSCLMKYPPRKQVPVGSNHQADIPEYVKEEILDRSETCTNSELMEKCIIPMPDSDLCGTGLGRKECRCLDRSSISCVRQHIMEARESLIETIGYGRFMELGFCEMGEDVASIWTEDEEDLFHKVVYSNPVSLGRDFWKILKGTFPSRTMSELVSYYFNVFILRRRGTQNRFKSLDVDSDDDEWQVEYDIFYSTKSDEQDNNGKSSSHEDDEEEEETNSDEDDDEEENSPADDGHCVYMNQDSRDGVDEEVNVEDDSCLSFQLQDSNLIFSHSPVENRGSHRSGNDPYSFDDRRLASDCWNKNNDLLPTSNIIEEIFGQDDWVENDDDNLKGK
ncbi:AT-rich interactive domain-containing protein 2 [Cardamine amara subsp. amara]|uniref:AT-rich interactive domain-containing protein 2 n=1 Tax=Cardamine amara subsp. amara TaxID=228776 RepID=A0ABD1BSY1_CARAN